MAYLAHSPFCVVAFFGRTVVSSPYLDLSLFIVQYFKWPLAYKGCTSTRHIQRPNKNPERLSDACRDCKLAGILVGATD